MIAWTPEMAYVIDQYSKKSDLWGKKHITSVGASFPVYKMNTQLNKNTEP